MRRTGRRRQNPRRKVVSSALAQFGPASARVTAVFVCAVLCCCAGADPPPDDDFGAALSRAALERTVHRVRYDGSYRRIEYPLGDVPPDVGVCTDVIIRSYRTLKIDLQQRVHEDMQGDFTEYPQLWNLQRPDSNIDHRRVPNLQTFFIRHGVDIPVSSDPADYRTGDLVTWTVGGNLPHIGIVVDRRSSDGRRPLIVHNIGAGPRLEDILFAYPITGHYRYEGGHAGTPGASDSSPRR